jgi:8-oxo-dGTP diphosphatase
VTDPASIPRTVAETDWPGWKPTDTATLVFVVRDGRILLIRKKRGLGAGKINGPGGRVEPGETLEECAVREVQEELRVTPTGLWHGGDHRFQFADGYAIHVHVYRASACEGEPRETDEAAPLWTPLEAIPYDEMWVDDALWLPLLLEGRRFSGRFIFDADEMLDHVLDVEAPGRESAPG